MKKPYYPQELEAYDVDEVIAFIERCEYANTETNGYDFDRPETDINYYVRLRGEM